MYIWEKGQAAGRVKLCVGNRGSGRVGSGQRFVGSSRVQEKWPVDNFCIISHAFLNMKNE